MSGTRRFIRVLSALALVMAGLVMSAGPAAASHLGCGALITRSTTLDSDIGPCAGDGLIIRANNVTVNLSGKRVFAAPNAGDIVGIRLANVTGVRVFNGTVEGFSAGVAIIGGSANTVQSVTARNNINQGLADTCDNGDGISMLHSNNNRITANTVDHNGPYGGISLIEASTGNQIAGNTVLNSDVVAAPGCGINSQQDEGIRIEGPGAKGNRVSGNTVKGSMLAGIGVHGHVGCTPNNPAANTENVIQANNVSATSGAASDGIAVLEQGPFGTVVCAAYHNTFMANTSSNNEGDGIFIPATSVNNTLMGNVVSKNGFDGIFLGGPIFQNVFTNVGPTQLNLVTPAQPAFIQGTDYVVLSGSGSGNVTAGVVPVGPIAIPPVGFDTSASGCSASDFVGFPAGAVALIQRGFCARDLKVTNAVAAGASAVIMFNEGSTGRTGVLTAGVSATTIPVLGTTYALGVQLYNLTLAGPVTIHVLTNTTNVLTQVAPGAENNTLLGNVGKGNLEHDGHDDNLNCDHNRWLGNAFGTVNQACVAPGATVRALRPLAATGTARNPLLLPAPARGSASGLRSSAS